MLLLLLKCTQRSVVGGVNIREARVAARFRSFACRDLTGAHHQLIAHALHLIFRSILHVTRCSWRLNVCVTTARASSSNGHRGWRSHLRTGALLFAIFTQPCFRFSSVVETGNDSACGCACKHVLCRFFRLIRLKKSYNNKRARAILK